MKKILSLLSVLTISGTAIPTTIAASPYQKEQIINSEINLQDNNLDNLIRFKRTASERNIYSMTRWKNIGTIRQLTVDAVRAAFWSANGFFTSGLISKMVFTIESNTRALVTLRERFDGDYFGQVRIYFNVDPNYETSEYSSDSSGSDSDEKDEL